MPDMSEKSSPAAPHDEAPILQGSAAIAPTAAGLAAKANDLEAIRDAVVDAAKISAGLWLSYLFVLFYLFVAAGGVTHKDLFLESPVKLPFLNVDLPILVYFWVGPAIFLVVHAYVLLHFRMLTGKVRVFDQELRAQIDPDQDDSNTRARLRRQLPNDIFVQFLAGPPEVRRGVIGALLKLIAWISLVLGPIALLGLFELQFLAYHSAWITWWQRFAMSLDLVLLWLLWPAVVRNARGSTWRRSAGWVVAGIATVVSLFLVFLLAIFPGEWLQLHLPLLPLQKQLVAGPIDQDNVLDAHRANSLWSYRLVLTGFNGIDNTRGVIDHTRVDTQQKIAPLPALRTRDFRSAVFIDAGLPKVDFTAANLKGTDFYRAHLEGANFTRARLEGAVLTEAHLEGAVLTNANFEGALLPRAYLQGADLSSAHLEGADLSGAHLEGAVLTQAQLEGANLNSAHLEGANLSDAHLEGALFKNAQLQGTLFIRAFFWRNDMSSANDQDAHIVGSILEQCPDKPCDWTAAKLQSLRQSLREQDAR